MRSLLAPALLLTVSATAQQPTTRPVYAPPSYSITVPYAGLPDFLHLDRTLKLLTSVNGGPAHEFTVDTGSVGIVVPASEVPNIDPKAPAGELRYSSSGLKLTGVWTRATVHFLDAAGKSPLAEATVSVLAVTSGECVGGGPNSSRCTGNIPHMLGVGFGRGSGDGMTKQSQNPFVNLTPMLTGEMRRGYLLTRAGITFGLTAPETRGFSFVKLTPRENTSQLENSKLKTDRSPESAAHDWTTAPGYLSVGPHDYPMGTILMDTGLTNMIVAEPGQAGGSELPDDATITIHLLGGALAYHFLLSDKNNALTPRRATWIRETHGPFINTGLRALACFDYLYDADNGYLALRPTCPAK